jgi:hypothetical protein
LAEPRGQVVALRHRFLQRQGKLGDVETQVGVGLALQGEQVGQLADLPASASSLPEIAWLSRICASTKTTSRKMMTSSSVASASTKPGQMSDEPIGLLRDLAMSAALA